jgi:hypothetical protein
MSAGKKSASLDGRTASLIDLIERAVARQLDAVEKAAGKLGAARGSEQAERDARTLASLARTMSALRTLRAAAAGVTKTENDSSPNVDDLRRELSERLSRFIAEDAGEVEEQPAE